MSLKKPLKRIALWALGAAALVAVLWSIWNVRSASRLQAAIDRASAAGLPVRFEELPGYLDGRFGPISSHENAAPLFQAAYGLLEDVVPPDLEDPLPVVDDELREYARKAGPALALIEQGLERDRCRYEPEWDDGVATRMPEVWGAIHASDALRAVAAIRLAEGDPEGALDQARALAGLARSFDEHPTLLGQMVRITLARRADAVLRAALPHAGQPYESWRSTAPPSPEGAVAYGLAGELCFMAYGLTVYGGPEEFYGPSQIGLVGKVTGRIGWPGTREAGAEMLESYLELIQQGNEPYPARMAHFTARYDRSKTGSLFGEELGLHLEPMITQEAEAASLGAVTEAGARVLGFRRQHGRWPSQLDEVPGVPTDPRTEKPLEMRVEGDALILAAPGGVGEWRLVPAV